MNKQNNKLALSVLAALTAGIALIYTLIMYHDIIFAVAGMSVLFLVTAYILTQNIITFTTMRNKSMSVQIKNMVDDLSSQLENMSSTQAQIGKATYLFTRQTARAVTILEGNYTESQEALYKNLAFLSSAQNKATKLMIKYDQNNTMKLISTMKEIRNQLSETMVQGFDQITPNNDEVIATLQTIVDYLNSQSNEMDQTMGLQLDKVARELQNISSNIQKVQLSAQNMMQAIPEQTVLQTQPVQVEEAPVMEQVPAKEPGTEPLPESMAADITDTDDILMTEANGETDNTLMTVTIDEADNTITNDAAGEVPYSDNTSPISSDETATEADLTATSETPVSEPVNASPVSDNPNKQLSADEIAALFAATAPSPAKTENEPATKNPINIDDAIQEEEPFTPTFTVVGKSTKDEPEKERQEADSTEENVTAAETEISLPDREDDPNKQLSADEIAALFAAADPAPKKTAKAEEPVDTAPDAADPNKQLSADEIAALFAAAEPAPKAEEPVKEEPKAEPVDLTPVSDDPNKQLSPDEIAALFAQMG